MQCKNSGRYVWILRPKLVQQNSVQQYLLFLKCHVLFGPAFLQEIKRTNVEFFPATVFAFFLLEPDSDSESLQQHLIYSFTQIYCTKHSSDFSTAEELNGLYSKKKGIKHYLLELAAPTYSFFFFLALTVEHFCFTGQKKCVRKIKIKESKQK